MALTYVFSCVFSYDSLHTVCALVTGFHTVALPIFLSLPCLDLFQKRPQVARLDQIQTPRPVLRRHAEPVVLVADETAVLALREIERRRTAFFDREQAKRDRKSVV